jgi:hypothetical protein
MTQNPGILIAADYVLAFASGFAPVSVNELLTPADVSQNSGDMIVFVLTAGALSLASTRFTLRLAEKASRALLAGYCRQQRPAELAHDGPAQRSRGLQTNLTTICPH